MRSLRKLVYLAIGALCFGQAPSVLAQTGDTGETRRVSVTWQAAPLSEVLGAFAAISGASIVAGAGVEGFVTADINDQPWDIALRAILSSMGFFAIEEESGIIRVQSMADVTTQETVEPIVTRSYRLSFARASEIQGALAPLLSPRGSISILESSNTVIVSDIDRVQRSIAGLLQ
jgi:type II secretory pathway component GspD/PulD (secretin)